MNVTQYLEAMAMSVLGMAPAQNPDFSGKNILTNDLNNVMRQRLVEYVTWYAGDSDAMVNLYCVDNMTEFPTEPFYWKNRRESFWARASREPDFKLTHCDFAKDMVDTTVLVCGDPIVKVGGAVRQYCGLVDAEEALLGVLKSNDFMSVLRRKQMPYTLVEGWGGYKITWNVGLYGDDPVIHYYRAENVRVYRRANRVMGMTFLDWYRAPNGAKYLIAETRMRCKDGTYASRFDRFKAVSDDSMMVVSADELGVDGGEWKNMPCMFAEPCSFYDDPLHGYEGKSVLEGKLDMLDDLDQAYSIASGTVRGGMPTWTFDMDYCERDPKTKEPKMPKTFTKKYVTVSGQRNAFGEKDSSKPIEVVQPNLDIQMFDQHILSLQRSIVNGHLSPATLGLDVERKDSARDDPVRDIAVTLFTRNHLNKEEGAMLDRLFRQVLAAKEFLSTGKVSTKLEDWDVHVTFDEFADRSFEARAESLSSVLVNDGISPKMYVQKVYGSSISDEEKDELVGWITENHKNRTQDSGMGGQMGGIDMPEDEGGQGVSAVPDEGAVPEGE